MERLFVCLGYEDIARLLRCRNLARLPRASEPLPRSGSLSLACPRESNHRDGGNAKEKGTPDDAPSGPAALQVRGRASGFFDRTSVSCRKTGRIPAATLRAFLHPPAAVIRGPQEPEPKLAAVVFSRAPAPSPQPSPTRGEGEVQCLAKIQRSQPWGSAATSCLKPSSLRRVAV